MFQIAGTVFLLRETRLEDDSSAELNNPVGVLHIGDLAETSGGWREVGACEDWSIIDVETFQSKLEEGVFGEVEVFEDGGVPIVQCIVAEIGKLASESTNIILKLCTTVSILAD